MIYMVNRNFIKKCPFAIIHEYLNAAISFMIFTRSSMSFQRIKIMLYSKEINYSRIFYFKVVYLP